MDTKHRIQEQARQLETQWTQDERWAGIVRSYTAEEVVRGWMGSPGHRANILDGDLTQIGVGRADGGSYGVYWTQVFGTPR